MADEEKKKSSGPGAAGGGEKDAGSKAGPEAPEKEKSGSSGSGSEDGSKDKSDSGGSGSQTGGSADGGAKGPDTGGSADDQGSGKGKGQGQDSGDGQGAMGGDGDPTKNKLGKYDTGGSADDQKSGGKKSNKSMAQKLKGAAMKAQLAAQSAIAAMKALLALKLIMFLQMMMQAVVAAVAAAMAAISAIITTVVTALATALGVSIAVATFGIFGLLAVAVVVVVAVVVTQTEANNAQQRDSLPDCYTDISYMDVDETIAQDMMSNAKLIYSFFKAMDYSDAQVAGILGCWVAESGIDPTGVETCYGSKYGIDQRKMWFEKGQVRVTWNYSGTWPNTYHSSTTFQLTGDIIQYWDMVGRDPDTNEPIYEPAKRTVTNSGGYERSFAVSPGTYTINFETKYLLPFNVAYKDGQNYFIKYPGIQQVGIGLGQWTNGRTQMLLDYAEEHNRKWYELETQLLFMCTKDDASRVSWLLNQWVDDDHQLYANTEQGAKDACKRFAIRWEGCPNTSAFMDPRQQNAAEWFKIISGWTADVDYNAAAGQSLWEIVKAETSGTWDATQSTALRSCSGARFQDSHNAAAAIVSYAWGPGQPYENNGTHCWQHIHSVVAPHDAWLRACDRTVACAIRWSGTDTNYPLGACSTQMTYLTTSDAAYRQALLEGSRVTLSNNQAYWMEVTPIWNGNVAEYIAQLKPGDVLIRSDSEVGHTLMYVGNETIKRRWPDAPANLCVVSGSVPFTGCSGYSPHVGGFATAASGSGAYQTYKVFRCMKTYSNNSEWTSATCAEHDNDT